MPGKKAMNEELLDRFAPFYDLEYADYNADLDFYRQCVARVAPRGKRSVRVLDLACGTGRVALALAAYGHWVTGVDASPAMLAVAQTKAQTPGLDVRWMQAALQTLPGPETLGRFHLALCAVNSFAYLTEPADQLACLRQVHALLHPGGLLVLDLTPVPPGGPDPLDGAVIQQGVWPCADGGTVAKAVTGDWDPATQLHQVTWIYDLIDASGLVHRTVLPQTFRYLYRYEAEHLLARAGLDLIEIYGDYDLAPYTADSERLILLALRPHNEV
jgi:ubiquinone/menaquinone biosynthesis C-methylase UbiE